MTTPTPETLAEELARRVDDKAKTRVLGITEKKQLAKLIDSDYDLLKADVVQYGAELTRQRTIEVNAQYADKEMLTEPFRMEWNTLRERWRTEYVAFLERCRAEGLTAKAAGGGYGSELFSAKAAVFEIPGREHAIKEVANEVKHTLDRARHALEKKRMESQRNLLTHGGLPPEARELLAAMPDPREVLLAAMQQAPGLLALTQAARAPQVHIINEDNDVVEGLVIHEEQNFGDRV